jgi:hypothetical protein
VQAYDDGDTEKFDKPGVLAGTLSRPTADGGNGGAVDKGDDWGGVAADKSADGVVNPLTKKNLESFRAY